MEALGEELGSLAGAVAKKGVVVEHTGGMVQALREALPSVTPNDGYTAGWVWAYPLKAALQKAAENKDLTRAGVLNAVRQLESVDYEGMLPT
ncbi:hypothetical protein K7G98_39655, partial [Saccharothrix sp. MB29]|nr:hypothetical protein [Saccharothrix sp. MB29]